MRILLPLTIATLALSASFTGAFAEENESSAPLLIENPYAFATSEAQANGAAFMSLVNTTDADITVTAADTTLSETVELHTHIMEDDKMMMREVDSFVVPAGETHTLEPMGDHIMLMGLYAPLQEGHVFPLSLTLEGGETLETSVQIVAPGTSPDMDETMHGETKEAADMEEHEHDGHDHAH